MPKRYIKECFWDLDRVGGQILRRVGKRNNYRLEGD